MESYLMRSDEMPNPWFRFYSETLRDRKLERVARVTKQPKALLIGVWATFLALANDSPVRGVLLLTEDIPLVFGDLCLETGLDEESLKPIFDQFVAMGMVSIEDGVYHLTNWDKRQFKSDDSTSRVRAWRAKQKEENGEAGEEEEDSEDDPEDATEQEIECNGDETLQESSSNTPDTETDTETDTDTEKTILSASADYQAIRKRWIELFPDKATPRESNRTLQGKVKTRMKSADFRENWEPALERASKSSFLNQESWFYLDWFLKNDDNWHKCFIGKYDDKAPPGTVPKKPPEKRMVTIRDPYTGEVKQIEATK